MNHANDFNLGLFVVFCLAVGCFLIWITKLRRENRTLKKAIKYQKQIIDGKDLRKDRAKAG